MVYAKRGKPTTELLLVVEQLGSHPLKGKRFEAPPPRVQVPYEFNQWYRIKVCLLLAKITWQRPSVSNHHAGWTMTDSRGMLRSSQLSAAILRRQPYSARAAVQKLRGKNLYEKIVDSPYHPLQLPALFGPHRRRAPIKPGVLYSKSWRFAGQVTPAGKHPQVTDSLRATHAQFQLLHQSMFTGLRGHLAHLATQRKAPLTINHLI
jgi:hypothetical protein